MDSGFIYPPLKNWKFTIQFFSLLSVFFFSIPLLSWIEIARNLDIANIIGSVARFTIVLKYLSVKYLKRACLYWNETGSRSMRLRMGWKYTRFNVISTLLFFFFKFSLRHAREIVFETTPSNRKNAVVWAISRIRRANDEYVLFRLDYQTVEEGGGPSGCTKSRKCWENVWSIRGIFHVGTWP